MCACVCVCVFAGSAVFETKKTKIKQMWGKGQRKSQGTAYVPGLGDGVVRWVERTGRGVVAPKAGLETAPGVVGVLKVLRKRSGPST